MQRKTYKNFLHKFLSKNYIYSPKRVHFNILRKSFSGGPPSFYLEIVFHNIIFITSNPPIIIHFGLALSCVGFIISKNTNEFYQASTKKYLEHICIGINSKIKISMFTGDGGCYWLFSRRQKQVHHCLMAVLHMVS